MSSCISGGGRAYRLNIEIIKSPSTSWASNSSSPSSTLSESRNSPCAISTRKPRTPRKRPNQKYDEAAAILSTAYPKIFSTKHLTKPCKFSNPHDKKSKNHPTLLEPSDLLTPLRIIDNSCFLLHPPIQERPNFPIELKGEILFEKLCQSPGEINSHPSPFVDNQEDFDAESILDEETEEGIDSILGNLSMSNDLIDESSTSSNTMQMNTFCYGYPVGLGFGFGMRRELKAMKNVDEGGDWWRFPAVNMLDLTPKVAKKSAAEKKKKKVKKMVSIKNLESVKKDSNSMADISSSAEEGPIPQANGRLLLKLNYDDVLSEWSDKGSPFSGDSPAAESDRSDDVQARLAQIDLFGGERDAIVLRYKEKRRTRLSSKKVRYQVRKVNADRRPRMKGRFVRGVDS